MYNFTIINDTMMEYFAKRISITTERLMNKVHQTTLTLCPLQ